MHRTVERGGYRRSIPTSLARRRGRFQQGQQPVAEIRPVHRLGSGSRGILQLQTGQTALLAALTPGSLLLADRLPGCPAMLYALYGQLLALGSYFLVRLRKNLTVLKRRRLSDGTSLIEVAFLNCWQFLA